MESVAARRARPAFVIRDRLPSDEGFIATSWLATFQGSDPAYRYVGLSRLHRSVLPLIEDILKRAEVRIIAPPKDNRTIYGFAVWEPAHELEPSIIHMVYVREAHRRFGYAAELLKGIDLSSCAWSTQSKDFREWIRHKYPMKEYRPFWLVERKQNGRDG